MDIITTFDLRFSYSQFIMYDSSITLPAIDWTDAHSRQGFARRDSILNMGTLLTHGQSRATVYRGPPTRLDGYERVIAVPFHVSTGEIIFRQPDDLPEQGERLRVETGDYRVIIAQARETNALERIDIFFDAGKSERSELLVCDAELSPEYPLLETSEVYDD